MQRLLCVVVTLGFALAGCNEARARADADPQGEKATGAYKLTVVPPSAGKVGQSLAATVKLQPKAPYKVNMEYPIKLTVNGTAGASPDKKVLRAKDAKKLDKKVAHFAPGTKCAKAGEHKISATFKLSVCTDKQCELKTEKISWVVKAN